MSRFCFVAVALAMALGGLALASSGEPEASEPEEPIVHEPGNEVRFERDCSDAEPYRVQAYAALRSEDGRARALVNLYARRDAVRLDEVFVGMRLVAMAIDAGPKWAAAPFSIYMSARSTDRMILGADHARFDANPAPGDGERRAFRTDGGGRMAWLDFVEPTEPEGETDRSYNWSPDLEVTATELGLADHDRSATLDLTVAHAQTDAEIRLAGPALWVPEKIWSQKPDKPKALGLFGMLNPFEKGSVWRWLAHGTRYGHCIDERRQAKRWFSEGAIREADRAAS